MCSILGHPRAALAGFAARLPVALADSGTAPLPWTSTWLLDLLSNVDLAVSPQSSGQDRRNSLRHHVHNPAQMSYWPGATNQMTPLVGLLLPGASTSTWRTLDEPDLCHWLRMSDLGSGHASEFYGL